MAGTFDTMILAPRTFDLAGVALPAEDLESLQGLAPAMAEVGFETEGILPSEAGRDLASLLSGLSVLQGRQPSKYERGARRFLLSRPFQMFDPAKAIPLGAALAVGREGTAVPESESPGFQWVIAHLEQITLAFVDEVLAIHPLLPGFIINGRALSDARTRFREKFPSVRPVCYRVGSYSGPEWSGLFADGDSPEIVPNDSWETRHIRTGEDRQRVNHNEGLEGLEPLDRAILLGEMKKYRAELMGVGLPVRGDGTIAVGSKDDFIRYLVAIGAADTRRRESGSILYEMASTSYGCFIHCFSNDRVPEAKGLSINRNMRLFFDKEERLFRMSVSIERQPDGEVLDLTQGPVPGVSLVYQSGDPDEGELSGYRIVSLRPPPKPKILISFVMERMK